MAKQTINIGTADRGDGDPIRTAFNKVNANFTELYTALGLGDASLNLGSFEFTNNVMTTTDSSAVIIDQNVTITNELTMQGDIVPNLAGEHNLGSAAKPWGSLYVSNSTIYIGGNALGLDNEGELVWNGSRIAHAGGEYITLDSLTDVNANSPNAGDTIVWNGGAWVNSILPTLTSQLTNDSGFVTTSGITASSSDVLTNKTINIQAGQGNVFQIQGNSITSYSGSGSVLALTSMPTFSGMNVNNSSLSMDGGSGSYYWAPTFADGTGTINKAGVYKSANNANNSLFTFGANGAGTMSVVMDGSLFVGSSLPSNNGGLNTNYGGWLVVQAGAKFGGDLNTIGNFILDTPGNYVRFGDGTTQTTAADFGYLDLDKDTIKGTAGYQYTFATDGYFTNSTSSESLSYFFVTYNTTNTNIAAGWTVVGGTANTTVSSVTYPVAGYPGVIQVNLTQPASSTAGFYPVTVTSPDRLRVEIQPNPGTSDKFAFTTSGITFPNGAQILKTVGVDDSITIGATGTPGTITFNGSGFFNDDTFFHKAIQEKFSSLQDATGVVTHNCANGHIFYHTSPDANWTVNLTNFSLVTNYATAITVIISQGGTGYYPNALQIGGAAQTINWQGNATPTPSSNRVDVVTFSIFLTGGGYTVLGQLTGF